MADPAVISLVVDEIVAAFDGDVELFRAWLDRSKVATELEQLRSELRNLQAAEDAQNQEYQAAIVAQADLISIKQAELDAL